MDRNIVYPSEVPQDFDILNVNRNTMIALGSLLSATIGAGTWLDGLACTPVGSAAPLSVVIGPGSITTQSVVDSTAYGSLPADTSDMLTKQGINLLATTLPITPPVTAGQSINYLIEFGFSETDANPTVSSYYNSLNPAQPYSGPGNSGAAQNTVRQQRANIVLKAGAPAATGSQQTPTPDAGFVGAWVVTVGNGQTAITQANIAAYPGAPFLGTKIGGINSAISAIFTSANSWSGENTYSTSPIVPNRVDGDATGYAANTFFVQRAIQLLVSTEANNWVQPQTFTLGSLTSAPSNYADNSSAIANTNFVQGAIGAKFAFGQNGNDHWAVLGPIQIAYGTATVPASNSAISTTPVTFARQFGTNGNGGPIAVSVLAGGLATPNGENPSGYYRNLTSAGVTVGLETHTGSQATVVNITQSVPCTYIVIGGS